MAERIVDSENFEQYLISHPFSGKPENLYNAMNYIMQLGGKRMRPKFLLLAYQSVCGRTDENAMKLALAIETFHNFSLVHDDIMDNAPLRRGKKTVHEEWDTATAILAGDNLLLKCFSLIIETGFASQNHLLSLFTQMSARVCEGQQMDMNLPLQEHITEEEYLKMIEYKTAVLPACALEMGAMAAGASDLVSNTFREFGRNIGMAFQLQDDYLDCFGSADKTGKQEGGDIIENKRTLLFLHAEKTLKGEHREEFLRWYNSPVHDMDMKVKRVRELYRQAASDTYLLDLKSAYEAKALDLLSQLQLSTKANEEFRMLFGLLQNRES